MIIDNLYDLKGINASLETCDFSGGSEVKASACNAGDQSSIPWSGRSPGEGNGYPLQYSCLENPMEGGAWCAIVHGVAKSQTRLNDFAFTFNASLRASLVAQMVKSLPAMQETQGRSLGQEGRRRRKWLPTPGFLPRKSHAQRSLAGCGPWGRKELDRTE